MAGVAMRHRRAALVAMTAAMLVVGAACGSSDGPGDSTAAGSVKNGPITIHAGANDPEHPQIAVMQYIPARAKVSVGEKVVWSWAETREPHSVTFFPAEQRAPEPGSDPALEPWPRLDAGFKSSNRQQADHIDVKLRAVGCRRLAEGEAPPAGSRPFEGFLKDEVELLARMEHARWCADRYLGGWRLVEKADKPRKISPYLVPYEKLTEEIKTYDREAVLQIPELVGLAGQQIVRVG